MSAEAATAAATGVPEVTLTVESGSHPLDELRTVVDRALRNRGEEMSAEYPITVERDGNKFTVSGSSLGVRDFRDRLADAARDNGLKGLRVDDNPLFPHEAAAA